MIDFAAPSPIQPLALDESNLSVNQKAFLQAYASTGKLTEAAELSEVNYCQHYRWLADESYQYYFAVAEKIAVSRNEDEIRRRGFEGDREIVTDKGKAVFVWVDPEGNIVPPDEAEDVKAKRKPVYRSKRSDRCLLAWQAAHDPRYSARPEVQMQVNQQFNSGDDENAETIEDFKTLPVAPEDIQEAVRQLAECGLVELDSDVSADQIDD